MNEKKTGLVARKLSLSMSSMDHGAWGWSDGKKAARKEKEGAKSQVNNTAVMLYGVFGQ